MFDVSLVELLTIFLVAILVLKPRDAVSIFTKFKNFSNNLTRQNFLDFEEISVIEEKEAVFSLKDEEKEK